MNEFKAARYQYGVDPVYGRTSFLPVDRDKEYFASEGLYVREEAYVALEAALAAATDASSCPGHGRSECVSCCWPKGAAPEPAGYTAVDLGTAAADGYREGKANPELQMQHVAQALEAVRGGPVLTSNQCYDLARALNGIQRDRVKS